MNLSIDRLQQMGAFTGAPVEKEITWECQGEEYTATVYVRRLSYMTAVYDAQAFGGQVDGIAGRIAASICDDKGKPVFTPQDVTGEADPDRGPLDHNLTMALLGVIGEVNNPGKAKS
ncbi:phage tail assembly chaperone family protein, TAC [Halomonas getboli]|uniref:phage tail assembly chaperone family protein, TAC n=1 Tax=Halomonas getboli TaxID=2935862 RepID=UPI001FFEEFBA|nr:phage tail assembly chaperone family protein, TAC [Halomonas getboli]MCK2183504.1 phage tail assembly chaperone family protein, TAC [Halomonas getboli]